MSILFADKLTKSFGATVALQGATMSLEPSEILAVMGPSGSGKSTLLHCLAGIFAPNSGTVTFNGRRLDTLSDRERTRLRRSDFGFVFQFGQLVPGADRARQRRLAAALGGCTARQRLRTSPGPGSRAWN